MPFEGDGSPEKWLAFLEKVENVIKGQNLTTGAQRFNLYRRILTSKALAKFNQAAALDGGESNANLASALQALTNYLLSRSAVQAQKRYMRRICRKPIDMSMKDYMARYQELNRYLGKFDAIQGEANMLPEDEVKEHAEFAIPQKWRHQMAVQGFEPYEKTLDEFVDFCERLEFAERMMESAHAITNPQNIGKKFRTNDKPRDGMRTQLMRQPGNNGRNEKGPTHYCQFHGPNWSHDTNQ